MSVAMRLNVSVVIATRNRPEPLADTLKSLSRQLRPPDEVVIVDSSDSENTRKTIDEMRTELGFPVSFEHHLRPSSARQRNAGAAIAKGDVLAFLDDDLELDFDFLDQLLSVFENDGDHKIGGATGAIRNQPFTEPRGLNRLLLAPGVGRWKGSFAGRLLGPAVNFLPADSEGVEDVDWLPSCCVAYRRDVFLSQQFPNTFEGYSFAEDVHLSSRVSKHYRVVCAGKARVHHHDLGKNTHKDWRALGRSMFLNRYAVMSDVLERRSSLSFLQLTYFELFYSSLTWLAAGRSRARLEILRDLLRGKLEAFFTISKARIAGERATP